jgi:hypothetical protein
VLLQLLNIGFSTSRTCERSDTHKPDENAGQGRSCKWANAYGIRSALDFQADSLLRKRGTNTEQIAEEILTIVCGVRLGIVSLKVILRRASEGAYEREYGKDSGGKWYDISFRMMDITVSVEVLIRL